MSSHQGQTLNPGDLDERFTWGAGEREFFREEGFTGPPKRCEGCRRAGTDRRAGSGRKGGRE